MRSTVEFGLRVIQASIDAVLLQKLVMTALFLDLAIADDQNSAGISNGG